MMNLAKIEVLNSLFPTELSRGGIPYPQCTPISYVKTTVDWRKRGYLSKYSWPLGFCSLYFTLHEVDFSLEQERNN